jgi:hypothetical protein
VRSVVEHHRYLPAHDVDERGRAALVWDVDCLYAGHALKERHGEMREAATAAGGVGQFSRLRLCERDEFLHSLRRDFRVDDQHERVLHHQADRRKVLFRVIRQGAVQALIDGKRGARRHQQRVAVGRRLGDILRGDLRGRAGPVLDDERLAESR